MPERLSWGRPVCPGLGGKLREGPKSLCQGLQIRSSLHNRLETSVVLTPARGEDSIQCQVCVLPEGSPGHLVKGLAATHVPGSPRPRESTFQVMYVPGNPRPRESTSREPESQGIHISLDDEESGKEESKLVEMSKGQNI